ncbi:hypothetical protein BAUCODRAFT_543523 [Baudoinia panamericana UAMH 10762]|uniref:Xaa-Pro dipeptidyl-peptidase C-terminal domain-containing protein n=1 Tax=Baudoinia panamericana (strain UAMH 10762) TaxID=717646 RepID=M2N8U3_BAUPA|nr:uncharacterized protein BAUCODRAFT_543523 [Baudoinia panamericana UAMH 10762]EMC95494.1 hypothetical protein BAUCODRAFT_543523 [Baudoinia panamericana UAMH 10762]
MMASSIKDACTIDTESYPYIYEQNVAIPIKIDGQHTGQPQDIVRCNVYRPKGPEKTTYPVLLTYGPYGKDVPYEVFHPASFAEVDPGQKSEHSCWETPDPLYWTSHGYAVVRADERGTGQSPGVLDTMSRATSEVFFDVVEWAAVQPWSSGKTALLGVSYYAGSQWRVAARRPKGLTAIVPWEGMSDYYRDRCRQGGIFENGFIFFWWNRQVVSNQYGIPNGKWKIEPVDGPISDERRAELRNDQVVDNASNKFRDDQYYSSKEYALEDIEVPVLSVANWGGITVHLRGNVEGYTHAGSKLKYLRFITGRHDLPFFYPEEVEIQRSFLDAFLRNDDREGWSIPGKVPAVDLLLRKGNIGVNKTETERFAFKRRHENEWPIARTKYTPFYMTPNLELGMQKPDLTTPATLRYQALGSEGNAQSFKFMTAPFKQETEITGHVVAHINVSLEATADNKNPSDIDIFATLRHIAPDGAEVLYTGSAGDPVPLCNGWLRVSLRKVNESHPRHRAWLPQRDYLRSDAQPVRPGEVYGVDVELWPTNVVVEEGGRLALEIGSGDLKNAGLFKHDHPEDRPVSTFGGANHIHFGPSVENYVTLPIIPPREG